VIVSEIGVTLLTLAYAVTWISEQTTEVSCRTGLVGPTALVAAPREGMNLELRSTLRAIIEVMAVEDGETDLDDPRLEQSRFATIFERHFAEIYRFLALRVGPSMAEDLAADTFLQAFRSLHRYDRGRGSVRAWLYGIATNVVRHHRRAERRQFVAYSKASMRGIDVPDESVGVDSRIDSVSELLRVLAHLDAKARDVVLLVGAAGLTYEEAAVALDIPVGTVRSRYSRARARLQKRSQTSSDSNEEKGEAK
jgi:RNA polymerase sigma factor (sigma-70 family)